MRVRLLNQAKLGELVGAVGMAGGRFLSPGEGDVYELELPGPQPVQQLRRALADVDPRWEDWLDIVRD
jgi:hypothetical protein